ncbi:unnamed protein product [Aphanomyces euteiches]
MADAILRSPELLPLVTVFQDGVWEMMHQELQAWQLLFRETDRSRLWESLMRVPVYRLRSLSDPRYVLHHALVTKQSIDHVRRMMQRYPDRISPEFFALASEHLTLGQFREVYKEALTLGWNKKPTVSSSRFHPDEDNMEPEHKYISTENIQSMLDENSAMIVEIIQLNNAVKHERGAQLAEVQDKLDKKRKKLNRNLMTLAKWADESTEPPVKARPPPVQQAPQIQAPQQSTQQINPIAQQAPNAYGNTHQQPQEDQVYAQSNPADTFQQDAPPSDAAPVETKPDDMPQDQVMESAEEPAVDTPGDASMEVSEEPAVNEAPEDESMDPAASDFDAENAAVKEDTEQVKEDEEQVEDTVEPVKAEDEVEKPLKEEEKVKDDEQVKEEEPKVEEPIKDEEMAPEEAAAPEDVKTEEPVAPDAVESTEAEVASTESAAEEVAKSEPPTEAETAPAAEETEDPVAEEANAPEAPVAEGADAPQAPEGESATTTSEEAEAPATEPTVEASNDAEASAPSSDS